MMLLGFVRNRLIDRLIRASKHADLGLQSMEMKLFSICSLAVSILMQGWRINQEMYGFWKKLVGGLDG